MTTRQDAHGWLVIWLVGCLVGGLVGCPAPTPRTQPRVGAAAPDTPPDSAADEPRLVEVQNGYGSFYLRWTLPGEPVRMSEPDVEFGETLDLYCPYQKGAVLLCQRRGDDVVQNGRVVGVDLRNRHPASLKRVLQLGKKTRVLLWERPKGVDHKLLKAIGRSAPKIDLLVLTHFGYMEKEQSRTLERLRHNVRGLHIAKHSGLKPSQITGFRRLRTLYMDWGYSPTTVPDLSALPDLEVLRLGYLSTRSLGDLTPLVRLRKLRVLRLSMARVKSTTLKRLAHLPRLRALQFKRCFLGSTALRGLSRIKGLRLLDLQANNVSTRGLEHLTALRRLKVLKIGWVGKSRLSWGSQYWSGFNDQSLAVVGRMKQLEGLSLAVNKRITSRGLAHLKSLVRLRDLDLMVTNVDDAGLTHLRPLIRLRRLSLAGTRVHGPGLRHLAPLTQLEVLDARGLKTGGLRHLPALPRLRSLSITRGRLTASELVHLKRQRRLEQLRVALKGKAGSGLAHLRSLPLRHLSILRTEVTAAGLEAISRLSGLRTLVLYSYKGPTAKLAVLARLKNLERLVLSGDFKDEALRHLKGLTRLRSLTISAWEVKGAGVSHLKALRNLRVLDLSGCKGGSLYESDVASLPALRDYTPPRKESYSMGSGLRTDRPDVLVRKR